MKTLEKYIIRKKCFSRKQCSFLGKHYITQTNLVSRLESFKQNERVRFQIKIKSSGWGGTLANNL
jgi:hypothetical protein